jgi:hypothetical protein
MKCTCGNDTFYLTEVYTWEVTIERNELDAFSPATEILSVKCAKCDEDVENWEDLEINFN